MTQSARREIVIDIALGAGVIWSAAIVAHLGNVGIEQAFRQLWSVGWSTCYLTLAGAMMIIAETDYPRQIRESAPLKRQARVVVVWMFLASYIFMSATGLIHPIPDLAIETFASGFALASAALLALHARTALRTDPARQV